MLAVAMVVRVSHERQRRHLGSVATRGLLLEDLVVLQPVFQLNLEYLLQTSEMTLE